MSHFTRIRTKLRDAEVLLSALKSLGYTEVELHDSPQTLYGHQGDARPERAEIIVRREHIGRSSNDIGFARRPDNSFEAIISEFDRPRLGQDWFSGLTRAYSHVATLKYAETHGYEVATDEVQEDGSRHLTLRRIA